MFSYGASSVLRRNRRITLLAAISIVLGLLQNSCGGGGGGGGNYTPPQIAVTISPTTANVIAGATQQFAATVTGTSNTAVDWAVNDVGGGNSTLGTISSNGVYTAPATVPNPATVTVKATSQADTTKWATATVTIIPPVVVTVSPSTANVTVGSTQQFTANVTGSSNTEVSWSVNDVAGGNSTVGTISTSGLYTAPGTVPNPATVTVKATSQADTTKWATATVTIIPPVAVTLSPSTTTLAVNATQQFTATVTGSSNTGVTWSVNDLVGGNSTLGTISSSGLYTAPATVPNPATVTVKANSQADTTKWATATVTVKPAVAVTVSPSTATVTVNGTEQFTATVTGSGNTAVSWSVNDVVGGNSTVGTISSSGLYTAPATVPNPATVTVKATSQADTTKSAAASVALCYPLPTVSGVSPDSAEINSSGISITVNGGGFTPVSTAIFGSMNLLTTFVSPSQLTASVPASALQTIGTVSVKVNNPSPGGGTSATSAQFHVQGGYLTVSIVGLPSGSSANVNVSGPNGYSKTLAVGLTLALAAGSYTVIGNTVSAGTSDYFASPASQTVGVVDGGTASVAVDYSTIIPKTTKVLDQTAMQGLTISPDGATLTLPSSSPVAQALHAGDVLASAPTTAAPKGLLVKIASVTQNGSEVDASVTQATLSDAIQQAHFTFNQPIGASSAMKITKALPGVKFLKKSRVQPETQDVSDPCAGIPLTAAKMYSVPLFDSPSLYILGQGELDVCPSIEFDVDFGFLSISSITAKATLGEYAEISLSGWGAVSVDKKINIATVEFGDVLVFVGPVPVLLTPTATFFVGAKGDLSGDFYTGFKQEAQASVGILYSNGQVTPFSNISFAASPVPLSLDAGFNLKGFAGVEIGLQIDGVVTPYFAPDAYLKFSADITQNPWWTLGAGLEGAVGVHVGILGQNLAEFGPYEVFDYPLATLAQAPGGLSIGDVEPKVISISPKTTPAGSASLTLGVIGSNFAPNSVVYFNWNPLQTTFFGSSTGPNYLTATLPAAYLVTPGTFPVAVFTSKGLSSNAVNFTVVPVGNPVIVTGLSFNPTSIAAGGSTTGTVTLSGPAPSGGAAVTLSSSNNAVLPVTATITVPAGSSSTTFTATASSSVASTTQVAVSASYNGSSQNATLTVTATPVVHVTVSPSAVAVVTGTTQQFTAAVTGTSNTAVSWSVNGVAGGNSTVGTISSSGLYTAPATVPNPATVTVKATSQADTSKSASASVTINPRVAVSLSRSSLTFASQPLNTTSPAQSVTVTNTGTAALTITSVVASGDFAQTNTCVGNVVAPSATCTISVTFTPTAGGTRTGTITITDDATDSPQSVSLTGTGAGTGGFSIEKVSVASDGAQGNGDSHNAAISADGRLVAFSSSASNLVPGDTNGTMDIFVHDRQTGETTRVSVASDGSQGNGTSYATAISADGRFVAFESYASNLVPGDTNGTYDIFVHDRQTGETTRVSVASDGSQGNDTSFWPPAISADGRFVAFFSFASNLVPGDTNGATDVFVHDRQTGETTRVSVASDGSQGNGSSYATCAISADGRFVAFDSYASNLVAGDTNGTSDVFVHDRQTGETTRVSVASDGSQGNGTSYATAISADGRFVAFSSEASNLVTGDTNGVWDTFVHDRQTGETTRVSVASDSSQGNGVSFWTAISADGRFVAFRSDASNLVTGDTNGGSDTFVHDRQTGETTRVSVAVDGSQGNTYSYGAAISADGRFMAFGSDASNLVPGDTNGTEDIFVAANVAALGPQVKLSPTSLTFSDQGLTRISHQLSGIGFEGAESGDWGLTLSR